MAWCFGKREHTRHTEEPMKHTLLAATFFTLAASAASAQPMTLPLTAGNMLAQTHSRAIIISVTGTFQQLSGTLNYDLAAKTCSVDVTFVVNSLSLPNALIRSQTMSAGFLDPAEYPTQHYVGTCQGNMLVGNLTMRGQTHPFNMAVTLEGTNGVVTEMHTEGTLNRHDWGLNGLTMTVGKMIRVTNDISLNGQPPLPPAS
jgi:polyisoprenoid-binding protein YceI